MRRHHIWLASAPLIITYFLPFGNIWLRSVSVCNAWQAQWKIYEGWWELWSYLNRLWTKIHEIFGRCRKPFVLSKPFSDCLYHVSFRRYSPVSLEVVEKRSKCKYFWPPIFVGGTAPTFLWQFVRATYYPLLGKVWLSSVCWSPSAKPGNETECRIYRGWVKCRSTFKPFVDQRSWLFGTM